MNIKYEKAMQFLCDVCNRCMNEFDVLDENYEFWDNSDPVNQGYGFSFFGKKDKFMPIIAVRYSGFPEASITVFIENRNGNDIINGNYVALYTIKIDYKENMSEQEIKEVDDRYRKMIRYSIEKWSKYNKENQIGYIEEEERIQF
ncbi:hypothetical protein [uncultured Clostridium sp.]|jgi:hypothetical protein|uniref:hypothetical protein n=1 Tax=uncultured Clostridium sp. TaxID=59620 RepID=UPI00272D27A5|nr:hypothetical protein [uncultured Clostridium sp.]